MNSPYEYDALVHLRALLAAVVLRTHSLPCMRVNSTCITEYKYSVPMEMTTDATLLRTESDTLVFHICPCCRTYQHHQHH